MYPQRGQRGSFRGRGGRTNAIKAPLKGLFSDGIWKCNCDPRLPAQHSQTKNGGKNHGRWFYTCQQSQFKRCDFFLWDNDAKTREAAVVLNNSRSEPSATTPSKSFAGAGSTKASMGLVTPETESTYRGWEGREAVGVVPTPAALKGQGGRAGGLERGVGWGKNETQVTATTTDGSDDEFFDWPASDEEELEKMADEASGTSTSAVEKMFLQPETPRKAARTQELISPGKRRFEDLEATGGTVQYSTPASRLNGDDVFAPGSTDAKTVGTGLFATGLNSPAATPTPIRYRDVPLGTDSELASEILTTLTAHAVAVPAEAREAVKNICNRHVLYTRGIMKGRDVSRATAKAKEEKVVEMKVDVEGLKSERETDRAVIRHLRREMALRKEGMLG